MIALGTPVTYHHRAAVARYKRKYEGQERYWLLYEGSFNHMRPDLGFDNERDMFRDFPLQGQERNPINKTVMVWPEEGSGVVVGLVKRMKGISSPGYGGGDDWEPGYFDAKEGFELYAVRRELRGTDYYLVPIWAASPIYQANEA